MIILFCCKDYSWVDPSHKYCCEVFLKFGCQLEKINCLHSWLHETDQQLWCHIWDQGLCQETESTNKTGQPPCIYFAMGKMMYPICSLQSFVFAGHGVRNRTYKVTICCFVKDQFIIYFYNSFYKCFCNFLQLFQCHCVLPSVVCLTKLCGNESIIGAWPFSLNWKKNLGLKSGGMWCDSNVCVCCIYASAIRTWREVSAVLQPFTLR